MIWHLLEGDQTLGRGRTFWGAVGTVLIGAIGFGAFGSAFAVENASYFLVWLFMALGLAFMWGISGTMSFGQTAFFGIGAYAYAVLATNWGSKHGLTLLASFASLAIVAIAAITIGYFIFFGRVSGVLVSIVTLAVTLGLETFLSQTAGPQWRIGTAELGGFNGISTMPPVSLPFVDLELVGRPLFFTLLLLVCAVYLSLRALANSRFGDLMVASRDNPLRAEALGIDSRMVLFGAFIVGSTLAGLSGVAYASWGQYVSPDTMGLSAAAMPIIWVAVSGKDLTATLVGTLVLLALSQLLALYGSQYALVVLGGAMIVAVMTCPSGMIESSLRRWLNGGRVEDRDYMSTTEIGACDP